MKDDLKHRVMAEVCDDDMHDIGDMKYIGDMTHRLNT